MPQISIVIPVYNAGEYLEECLSSVKEQAFTDYECILIDDGSRDNSFAICKKFADADDRFRVYSQTNGGSSVARNRGLEKAKGQFVCFPDADDILEKNYLKDLFETACAFDADLTSCGYVSEKEGEIYFQSKQKRGVISKEKLYKYGVRFSRYGYVWNKLYKREYLEKNKIEFDEDVRYGEDTLFLSDVCLAGGVFALTDKNLYRYQRRANSLTKKYAALDGEKLRQMMASNRKILARSYAERGIKGQQFKLYYHKTLSLLLRCYRAKNFKEERKELKKYVAKHFFRYFCTTPAPKDFLAATALLILC